LTAFEVLDLDAEDWVEEEAEGTMEGIVKLERTMLADFTGGLMQSIHLLTLELAITHTRALCSLRCVAWIAVENRSSKYSEEKFTFLILSVTCIFLIGHSSE
jgi:hypothetical protein